MDCGPPFPQGWKKTEAFPDLCLKGETRAVVQSLQIHGRRSLQEIVASRRSMEREGEERSSRLSHQPTTSVSRNDVVNDRLLYIYSEKKQKITICNNLRNLVSSIVLPGIDRAGLTHPRTKHI
jgi:hypothetical protein